MEPKFTRINRDNCFGFSFIEMAMVLMIMGIIFTPLIAGLNIYIQNKRIKDTKENIETVRIAISDYVNRNGRLPCPAGLRPEMDTAEFGSEGNCSAVANSISVVPGSRPGTEVVIGAVPFRELRLASTIAQDAWRRRLTYAVTRHLAAPPPGAPPVTTTNPPAGAISFVDISGAPLRGPAGEGLFALISHGANGVGAHTVSSGEISSPCTGAAIETENCNNDFVFLGTSQREAGGADIYDDFATVERDLRGSSALPVCAAGQYVTSDGSRLVCVAATNIPNCTIDGQTLVHQDGAFVCAFVGDFLPIREDYATNPATGMIMQRASCPEGYSLFTPPGVSAPTTSLMATSLDINVGCGGVAYTSSGAAWPHNPRVYGCIRTASETATFYANSGQLLSRDSQMFFQIGVCAPPSDGGGGGGGEGY